MKILFPDQTAPHQEIEELLRFAVEGRKRIKDQLMRIDPTYADVRFGYMAVQSGELKLVTTQEEENHPRYYYSQVGQAVLEETRDDAADRGSEDDSDVAIALTEAAGSQNEPGDFGNDAGGGRFASGRRADPSPYRTGREQDG
jgi:ATP-dependent Lon protease